MRQRLLLALCAALTASLVLASLPASALPLSGLADEVSENQYRTYQVAIQDMGLGLYGGPAYNQGFRNRYNTGGSATESRGFKEATLYLTNTLTAMGLDVTVQSDYKNVVAELPGLATPDRIYIVSGHYDHPQYNGECPGGDDNASGTAAVLEAARVLSQYRFNATLRFIAWGGEEGWMLGSSDYVNNVVLPGHQNIVGMVNLDMILRPGWDTSPNEPKDLDVSTGDNPACNAFANSFLAAGHAYAPSLPFDSRDPQHEYWYPSDQGPFIAAGYPGLMVAENTAGEIWGGCNAYYHTANDATDRLANDPANPSHVTYDYGFATDVVRTTVGFLAQEAQLVEPAVPEPASLSLLALGACLLRRRLSRRTAA